MSRLEVLRNDLFLICRYDSDEPKYEEYNAALLKTIDRMTENMLTSAFNILRKANK